MHWFHPKPGQEFNSVINTPVPQHKRILHYAERWYPSQYPAILLAHLKGTLKPSYKRAVEEKKT